MKVGVDVCELSKVKLFTGVSNYICNILQQLQKIDCENEYFLYGNSEINFSINNPKWHKKIYSGLMGKSHSVWMNTILVRQLKEDYIDVFWQPAGALLPVFLLKNIKVILTIHDLVLYYYPETMAIGNRILSHLFFKMAVKKADAIIADSEATKDGFVDLYPCFKEKTTRIYPAGRILLSIEDKQQVIKDQAKEHVRQKFDIHSDYILAVGTIEPRKNLPNLIKAFELLVSANKNFVHSLVIVGKIGWGGVKMPLCDGKVKFLSYVSNEDLVSLYSGAAVFVMPSLYEGFGMPILEAMACGCPVITSNVSSMPEVAGDAAILVNPHDIKAIANAMNNVLNDKTLQESMQERGVRNVERFSWKKTAQETMKIINAN
jgi:glycosyltransferase involved in cell wall biosynthesis